MPRKKRDEYEEESFLDEVDGEIEDEDEVDAESDSAEEEDVTEEEDEEEPKPKAKRGRKSAKRKKAPKKDEPEPEPEAEEVSEDEAEEESPVEEEVEEEIDYPPDDEKAVAALQKLRVRLDVSEKGNVWRVIFDDSNGKDPALLLLNGLPALKELWLLGTKVTSEAADKFKEDNPKVTVYF